MTRARASSGSTYFIRTLAVWAAVAGGCANIPAPVPHPQREFTVRVSCRTTVHVDGRDVGALFAYAARATPGVAAEQRALPVLDLVSIVTTDGRIYYTDLVHQPIASQALRGCKLAMDSVRVTASAADLDGSYLLTPHRDVLEALDTGYQVHLAAGDDAVSVTFPPLYDTDLYAPYAVAGRSW
ncbi:MAG: hypothetical protein QME96_12145, partial [Myxococcota bacterium]|nr:hypothetical protein [Myxococcota bacterium]